MIQTDDQLFPVSLQIIYTGSGYAIKPAPDNSYKDALFSMMHLTGDSKRMYVTNSLLSTLDHSGRFYVRLVHVGPDGMKVDPFFNVDLNKLPTGPARGHDMLVN